MYLFVSASDEAGFGMGSTAVVWCFLRGTAVIRGQAEPSTREMGDQVNLETPPALPRKARAGRELASIRCRQLGSTSG